MKIRLIIVLAILSLIFFACQKEEESENPYSNGVTGETYNLSSEDMSYFPYKENDSLLFIEKDLEYLENEGYEVYYYTDQIDSGFVESNGNKYQYFQVRLKYPDWGFFWIFRLQKTKDGIKHIIKQYYDNEQSFFIYQLDEYKAFHSTLTLNGVEYNDVYYYIHYQIDNSSNDTTYYDEYYFAKDNGLVTLKDMIAIHFKK